MNYNELISKLENKPIQEVIDEAIDYLRIAELDEIEIILYCIKEKISEEVIEKYCRALLIANRRYGEIDYSEQYLIELREIYRRDPYNQEVAELFCDLLCYCICTYSQYQQEYYLKELLIVGKRFNDVESMKLNQVVSIVYTYIDELSVEEIKDKIIETIGNEEILN